MELEQANFLDTCGDGGGPWAGLWEFRNSADLIIPGATVFESPFAPLTPPMPRWQSSLTSARSAPPRSLSWFTAPMERNPPDQPLGGARHRTKLHPLTMAGRLVDSPTAVSSVSRLWSTGLSPDTGETIPGQESKCRQAMSPEMCRGSSCPDAHRHHRRNRVALQPGRRCSGNWENGNHGLPGANLDGGSKHQRRYRCVGG
jgi:hypothetical protein